MPEIDEYLDIKRNQRPLMLGTETTVEIERNNVVNEKGLLQDI
jgi:hypothetical protein